MNAEPTQRNGLTLVLLVVHTQKTALIRCIHPGTLNTGSSDSPQLVPLGTLSLLLALQYSEVYLGSSPLPVPVVTDPLIFLNQR